MERGAGGGGIGLPVADFGVASTGELLGDGACSLDVDFFAGFLADSGFSSDSDFSVSFLMCFVGVSVFCPDSELDGFAFFGGGFFELTAFEGAFSTVPSSAFWALLDVSLVTFWSPISEGDVSFTKPSLSAFFRTRSACASTRLDE